MSDGTGNWLRSACHSQIPLASNSTAFSKIQPRRAAFVQPADGERKTITVQLGERNLKASSGKSGTVERDAPSIGLSVRPLTKEEARAANVKPGTGLLIVDVEPGKLAAEAELREGDIILSANLKPIKSVEEFSKILREDAKKRGVIMLQLQRQGQTFFRSLALSDTSDSDKK